GMRRPPTSSRQTCLRSMLPPLGWALWNLPSSPPSVSASGFGRTSSPSASDLRAADQAVHAVFGANDAICNEREVRGDLMAKLRVHGFSVSLDGYGAGPNQDLENPLGVGGRALHE